MPSSAAFSGSGGVSLALPATARPVSLGTGQTLVVQLARLLAAEVTAKLLSVPPGRRLHNLETGHTALSKICA